MQVILNEYISAFIYVVKDVHDDACAFDKGCEGAANELLCMKCIDSKLVCTHSDNIIHGCHNM